MANPCCFFREDVLDAVSTVIVWKDTSLRYIGANQYFLKLVGMSEKELIGKTVFDLLAEDDAKQITENDSRVLQSQQPKSFHEIVTDRFGEERIYFSHKTPLFDEEGELIGIAIVSSDITSLELQESQLRQDLTAKRTYIDGMAYFNDVANIFNDMAAMLPANIYWKDINGVYLGCNDALLDFSGIGRSEGIVGKTIFELVEFESAQIVHDTDQRIMRMGVCESTEEEGKNNAGELRTYISHKVPVRNDANEVIGLLGISFDITDRRKMTDALLVAKQQAEMASHAKTEFIMNMSHDIRTPFVGILGFAELLERKEQDSEKKEMVGYIRESSERLLALLNEVIDIVNEETAQNHDDIEINMRELVHDLQKMMLARVELDKLTLIVTVHDSVPEIILGDKQGINRILLNLVGNAIKFTSKGSVTVEVSAIDFNKKHFTLRMVVTDTGMGIPEDKQQQIFERFTRLTQSWQGMVRGSGLGLYFVKSIVDRLGGSIKLQSVVGEGSEFCIEIPCLATQ